MSQENVEIVERVLQHLDRAGDLPEAPFATDWVLDLTHATRAPDHLPHYVGMAGWREFWSIWRESFDDLMMDWHAFHDVADRVVVEGRQHAIAKASRVPVEQALGAIYTLHDGLITRIE